MWRTAFNLCLGLVATGSVCAHVGGLHLTSGVADPSGFKLDIFRPAPHAVIRLGALQKSKFEIILKSRDVLPGPLTDWRVCYGLVGSEVSFAHKCFPLDNIGKLEADSILVAFTPKDIPTQELEVLEVPDERQSALAAMATCGGIAGISRLQNATMYWGLEHIGDGTKWVPEPQIQYQRRVRIFDERRCALMRFVGVARTNPVMAEVSVSGKTEPSLTRTTKTFSSPQDQLDQITDALGGPRTFWSVDFHIGTLADLVSTMSPWGVKVIGKSLTESSSIHKYLNNELKSFEEVKTLKVITRKSALALKDELDDSSNKLRRDFFEAYLDDPTFKGVDAFVCQFAASMCELYMPFDRPIIVLVSTRYENGRDWPEDRWIEWNDNLKRIASNPRNVVAANNAYDAAYIQHFTGIKVQILPSQCGYTGVTYAPSRSEILVGPGRSNEDSPGQAVHDHLVKSLLDTATHLGSELEFHPVRELYPFYEYSDLVSHQAIVLLPYQVSITSIIEYYRMNIPLYAPSLELLVRWQLDQNLVGERSWAGAKAKWAGHSIPPSFSIIEHHSNATRPDADPNNEFDPVGIAHWLQFSDFYQWPHVKTFDSWEDLVSQLNTISLDELRETSRNMQQQNDQILSQLRNDWELIFRRIFTRTSPASKVARPIAPSRDFDTSLATMYSTEVGVSTGDDDALFQPPRKVPVCFPREQRGRDGCVQKIVARKGQVNEQTIFGAVLLGLASRPDVSRIIDIGTYYGGGSTKYFSDGIQNRSHCTDVNETFSCCDAVVISIETFGPAYRHAAQYHRGNPVWLIHGTTVGVEAMLQPDEIPESEKSDHYQLYYDRDRELMTGTVPQLEKLCREVGDIDIVLIDGNKYTGFAEFDIAWRVCRPQFLALHDTAPVIVQKIEAYNQKHPGHFDQFAVGNDEGTSWAIYKPRYGS